MKYLIHIFTFSFLLFASKSAAAVITVNNQTEWNTLVSSPIMASDTVLITVGATVINTGALDILGTIINEGDFTMNSTGVAVNMMGNIINYGTFTVGTTGLSIVNGTFTNAGILNVNGAAIVIQTDGALYNTGTVNNSINIQNNASSSDFGTCTPIGGSLSGNPPSSTVPIGTACNDGNPSTVNDVTIDAACSCQGTLLTSSNNNIPTLSEWSVFILSITLLIIGVIGATQKSTLLAVRQ